MRPPKPPPTIATSAQIRFERCQRAFDLLTGDYIDWPIPSGVIEERLICVEQIDEVVAKEGVSQLSEPFCKQLQDRLGFLSIRIFIERLPGNPSRLRDRPNRNLKQRPPSS